MKKFSILCLVVTSSLLAAEPSAYGAGNLDSTDPYGLTSSEKRILRNSDKIDNLAQGIASVKVKLSRLNENYEGLRSVTEAFGSKIYKIDKKIRTIEENSLKKDEEIASLKQEIIDLKDYVNEGRSLQDTNQEKIRLVLGELSSLIDSINNNYVSKEYISKNYIAKEEFLKLQQKISDFSSAKKIESISKKSGAILLKEAIAFFKNRSYNEAKLRFKKLIEKKYKPARSNFFLGEIEYFQKSYANAIKYYKKSISLYDKAEYMPTLLYHTGISFSKLKQNKQATKFFNALKQGYPKSKEAKSIN